MRHAYQDLPLLPMPTGQGDNRKLLRLHLIDDHCMYTTPKEKHLELIHENDHIYKYLQNHRHIA